MTEPSEQPAGVASVVDAKKVIAGLDGEGVDVQLNVRSDNGGFCSVSTDTAHESLCILQVSNPL